MIGVWGHILYCELADSYSASETSLQFTNQDVTPPFAASGFIC